jgi:carboxylesterase
MMPSFGEAFQGEEHQGIKWRGGKYGALLIHGFPGTPAEMHPVARLLHEAGWTVHAPLLPGFGQEIDSLPDKRMGEWVTCVRDSLAQLKQTCEFVIIVGLSMGGALAVNANAENEVDGLVLLAPFWRIEHVLWRALPVLRYALPRFKPFKLFKPDFNDPETRAGILNFMPHVDLDDPEVQAGIMDFEIPISMIDQVRQVGQRGYHHAPQIHTSTLVIQGTQDELVHPQTTRQLIQRLAGQVQYVEVDAGHDLTNDNNAVWHDIEHTIMDFIELIKKGEKYG